MKKRVAAIVAAAAVLISLLTGVVLAATSAAEFTDVPENHPYYNPIDCVVRVDVMNGVTEDTFSPDTYATWGMLYTVMARIHGVDTDGGASWYEVGMDWAVGWGLTDGGEDPNAPLTLEETLTVLWKYMRCPHRTAPLDQWYKDSGQISEGALGAMNWAVRDGIISNDTDTLDPQRPVTRGELAALVCRIWRLCTKLDTAASAANGGSDSDANPSDLIPCTCITYCGAGPGCDKRITDTTPADPTGHNGCQRCILPSP